MCELPEVQPGSETGFEEIGYDYSVTFTIEGQKEDNGTVLFASDNATFYLADPEQGKLGFMRDGYLNTFNYRIPEGRTVTLTIQGNNRMTRLLENGQQKEELGPKTLYVVRESNRAHYQRGEAALFEPKVYDPATLTRIIKRSAAILNVPIDDDAALEISRRSRGTPRIANALLRRVRDFAQVKGSGRINTEIANIALSSLNIDQYGLDEIDNKILLTIIDKFRGGPVGVSTIATAIGEDAGTVEEVYEPYLIMEGFIKRTPRGRVVTPLAYKHLGRNMYDSDVATPGLFD